MKTILLKLEKALKSVSDSYPDFVRGSLRVVKNNPDKASMLLSYIEKHPEHNTSDITKFETEEILGIKPL